MKIPRGQGPLLGSKADLGKCLSRSGSAIGTRQCTNRIPALRRTREDGEFLAGIELHREILFHTQGRRGRGGECVIKPFVGLQS